MLNQDPSISDGLHDFLMRNINIVFLTTLFRLSKLAFVLLGLLRDPCSLHSCLIKGLEIDTKNCAQILVRRVLSGRYRITQEKFQYQGVEI